MRDLAAGSRIAILHSRATATEVEVGDTPGSGPDLGAPYPNPGRDLVRIPLSPGLEDARFEILDVLGRVVGIPEIVGGEAVARTSDLAPGVYFVRMKVARRILGRPLLVTR